LSGLSTRLILNNPLFPASPTAKSLREEQGIQYLGTGKLQEENRQQASGEQGSWIGQL
jgi:hypothetical protein